MRLFVSAFACMVLSVAGCNAPVEGAADAEAVAVTTQAVVLLSRIESETSTRTDVAARFVRTHGELERALRALGLDAVPPAPGECIVVRPSPIVLDTSPLETLLAIDLLNAGSLNLTAGAKTLGLEAREIPKVAEVVRGLVYATSTTHPAGATPSTYRLEATGNEWPGFRLDFEGPAELRDIRLSGSDSDDGPEVRWQPERSLSMEWAPGASSDLMVIELASDSLEIPVVKCGFADTGHAQLAPQWLGKAPRATLSFHRTRTVRWQSQGVPGELRFDVARSFPIVRTP